MSGKAIVTALMCAQKVLRESDLATVPILAPASGYLWQFGMCHGGICDASLPALHPYAETGEKLAQIVIV